jgi:putative transposase
VHSFGQRAEFVTQGLRAPENDYCESFNGKSRNEFLNGGIFYSLMEAQIVIEKCRVEYNTRRPHSALGYRPPSQAAYNTQAVLNLGHFLEDSLGCILATLE